MWIMNSPSWHERRLEARREGRDPRSVKKYAGDTKLWPYLALPILLWIVAWLFTR